MEKIEVIQRIISYILATMKGQTIRQLRRKGAKIGKDVQLLASLIDPNTACLIEIGDNVIITNATVYAHDASTKMYLGYTKISKTIIGNYVFVGAGSIILPGVTIGNYVIVGAGSIVRESIPDNCVVAGNPAKVICSFDEYIERNKGRMKNAPIYDKAISEMSMAEKERMCKEVGNKIGYEI